MIVIIAACGLYHRLRDLAGRAPTVFAFACLWGTFVTILAGA